MRSQATKPLSKKGALGKTALKASAKQSKRKPISPKKTKTLVSKSLVKSPKKTSKDDANSSNNDSESSNTEKNDTSTDSIKSGPSKPSTSRSNSPTKKSKKEPKEKKGEVKNSPEIKKIVSKKVIRKSKMTNKKGETDNDDVKYKINLDAVKKPSSKFCKAKTVIKKSGAHQKKKVVSPKKQDVQEKEQRDNEQTKTDNLDEKNESDNLKLLERKDEDKKDNYTTSNQNKTSIDVLPIITNPTLTTNNQSETPKTETERPPKFFTSSRSPRTVDIDVKCLKNSKGNLSVSERFLSLKTDEVKNPSNTLVSQGPEIDVYTFTEKVDSPKSILSDFRSPINKNVGRVRPIARVKGTIIDKKTDSEKKKYSPHRPIEEVVKQLKANKRSEDLNALSQSQDTLSSTSLDSSAISSSEKEAEENPKPIVSKSYKMVARKSSITGKPFSPIKFYEQDLSLPKSETATISPSTTVKKVSNKGKKQQKKVNLTDDELDTSKFSFAKNTFQYSSSDESVSESNDDNDSKCSFESNSPKSRKTKKRKYKRITDSIIKKNTSKELKELSKDSLVDLKDESLIVGNDKPSKRRLKLLSMWAGPKKHRMASLNAIAKVHCLYENESRTSMELGLMKTVDRQPIPSTSKACAIKKKETKPKDVEKQESTSESEYENKKDKKDDSSESSDDNPPARTLRGVPGIRSAGKYWDPRSSTSSSEDSELESKKKAASAEKKKTASKTSSSKSDTEKPPAKMKKTAGVPVKKKRNRNEVVMDLKDMVVQKRMASLNATAILAASYEKRSPKSSKDDTTSDSCSDESFSQKSKNGVSSGVKSEIKHEDTKNEMDESVTADSKQKVEVIVNQDTDVTITGVYSTHHHEGFCTVSGMQYRISSTSHTQTTATANCDKEGCSREEARYTPLSALSSMNPPADHAHGHPHPVPELGGLARRAAGCSSAFSAPSPAAHHEPGNLRRKEGPRSFKIMDDVYNFLKDIGCADIIEVFKEQEIDLETVFLLQENELKELFPKIGPRLKFKKYIEKQKSTNDIAITFIDEISVQSESGSTTESTVSGSTTELTVSAKANDVQENIFNNPFSEESVPAIESNTQYENNAASLDGRAILREGQIGGGLLKECSRRKLSQLLIHNQLEQDPAKNISSQEFSQLASDICKVFEKESVLVYFSPYVAPTTLGAAKKNASGKLYETYISRRRKLRENGSLSRRSRSSSKSTTTSTASTVSNSSTFVTEDAAVNEDLQEEHLLWLRNNVDPWQTVEEKWKATTCTRLKNISKGDGLIEDYYKEFPALKQPQGYTLLIEDFRHLHPQNENGLFSTLALKKEIIIKQASKKVNNIRDKLVKKALTDLLGQINDADPETSTNVALMLLAYVINLSPARKKKNKPLLKPSRAEVCDSYISQACNEGAITSYMIAKKQKHLESGQTLQPYVIFVGDSVVEIKKAYVVVNDTLYVFQKLITAVDCAFKIFQALNAHYPAESEDVWTVIQIGFYDIKTPFDRNTQAVNTLLTDLELI